MSNKPDNVNQDDVTWQTALKAGKEQLGNLEANLRFLQQAQCFKADDRILEVGCGVGTIVNWLGQKGYNACGSDISETAIDYGRRKYPGIELTVESAQELCRQDGAFDAVLSFDVFEHLFDIDKHLQEVNRILKPGGYYLFQTPNKYSNALYETLRCRSFQWKKYHPSLHTPGQLKKRLNKHGFSANFVKISPVTPFFLNKLNSMSRFLAFVKYIPYEKLPLCMQTNLYVIAQKIQ